MPAIPPITQSIPVRMSRVLEGSKRSDRDSCGDN